MTELSDEQAAIVAAPLGPLSVVACAGSGKTMTAVRRLMSVRRMLREARGRVALLSFSNVAVETFRKSFAQLSAATPDLPRPERIEIDTVDGFITSNILKPHAYRTMGSARTAFLVTGEEPFLQGFLLRGERGGPPTFAAKLKAGWRQGGFYFYTDFHGNSIEPEAGQVSSLIKRLGKTGAYTHELGRYWCHRTLTAEPTLLAAFARRFPQILIDEAQDIGTAQRAILDLLTGAGSEISLIGDPHQGIYEYAGADGSYLRDHTTRDGTLQFKLTRNYRSIPAITSMANAITGRNDGVDRVHKDAPCGAYIIPYRKDGEATLVAAFEDAVSGARLNLENCAALCRATKLVETLSAGTQPVGVGVVKTLATAAVQRDQRHDYLKAFRLVAIAVENLLKVPPHGLAMRLCDARRHPELAPVRRTIWAFTRAADTGLPGTALQANTLWHKALKQRMAALLRQIEPLLGLAQAENLGNRLSARELPATPVSSLSPAPGKVRIDTVHQAKGESLDAVLYLATKAHIEALLAGPVSEEGRIGYVAVTRATDLIWLGVPQSSYVSLRPKLLARGFCELP